MHPVSCLVQESIQLSNFLPQTRQNKIMRVSWCSSNFQGQKRAGNWNIWGCQKHLCQRLMMQTAELLSSLRQATNHISRPKISRNLWHLDCYVTAHKRVSMFPELRLNRNGSVMWCDVRAPACHPLFWHARTPQHTHTHTHKSGKTEGSERPVEKLVQLSERKICLELAWNGVSTCPKNVFLLQPIGLSHWSCAQNLGPKYIVWITGDPKDLCDFFR